MDGTCVIKTEFLIIDEIRLLLMNILVKFQPDSDIHILMVMGGRLTCYGPKIGTKEANFSNLILFCRFF
jgi:hypothetical protein